LDTSNQKPDLLAPVRGAAEAGTRILATLEYGNRLPGRENQVQRWHLDGWTAGMGVAVLVMAALAWMSREAAIKGAPGRPLASSSMSSTAIPAASIAPEQQPSAATIVSLPEPASGAAAAVPAASARAATPSAPSAPAKPATPAASRSAVATASASPRDAAGARANAAAATTAAPPDTDIALLTALVAHAGASTSVTPERSRDVVLPQEGEGTTLLLARCKQLGLIEGMLCRSRICSGRWENDPACRAPNH